MSKHVKASEYYSRRVKDDSSESTKSSKVIIENNSDESDTSELFEKSKKSGNKNYSQTVQSSEGHRTNPVSMTETRVINQSPISVASEVKSTELKKVKADVKEITRNIANKDSDETKTLMRRMLGVEGVSVAEYDTVKSAKRLTQKAVHTTRYTVTLFSDEEKIKRYEEYRKNSKDLKKLQKEIKQEEKELKEKFPDTGKIAKYRTTVNRKKYAELSRKNGEIKKKRIAQRHTKRVNRIKDNALNNVKNTSKSLIKMPNRYTLMIADDLEAEGLLKNASISVVSSVFKGLNNLIKLFLSTLKNLMIALSPLLFGCVFIMFMIYIVFLSDFSSYFDIDKDSTLISSKETTYNLETLINESLVNRREEMAKEIVGSDKNSQIYFVNIEEFVINDARTSANKKAEEEGIIPVLFNEYISSDAGREFINNLAYNMCYILTDEEAVLYEGKLTEYSGNIKSDITTKPGIGAGLVIGSDIGTGTNQKKIVIGYHLMNE